MKAIDRIIQFIEYKGIRNSSFEKKNGLSNGYINTQLKRNADLGESILNKILNNSLEINPEWLLTGKGSMLKEQEGQTANTSSEVALLKEQISLLKENKALINKECQRLQCEIKQLQERVALLEQENKTLKSV